MDEPGFKAYVPLVIDCHRLAKEKDIPFSPESMGAEVPAWSWNQKK